MVQKRSYFQTRQESTSSQVGLLLALSVFMHSCIYLHACIYIFTWCTCSTCEHRKRHVHGHKDATQVETLILHVYGLDFTWCTFTHVDGRHLACLAAKKEMAVGGWFSMCMYSCSWHICVLKSQAKCTYHVGRLFWKNVLSTCLIHIHTYIQQTALKSWKNPDQRTVYAEKKTRNTFVLSMYLYIERPVLLVLCQRYVPVIYLGCSAHGHVLAYCLSAI